jgi:hypothetical protein
LVNGVKRVYVKDDKITLKRPKRQQVQQELNPPACSCRIPCVFDWGFEQPDAFFDDDEAGIGRYEEWRILKEQEIQEEIKNET